MNKIEKAIEYLTPIAKSASKKMQYGEMLNIAIEALKDKQQRNNIKCENCKHQFADVHETAKYCFMCSTRLDSNFEPEDKTE